MLIMKESIVFILEFILHRFDNHQHLPSKIRYFDYKSDSEEVRLLDFESSATPISTTSTYHPQPGVIQKHKTESSVERTALRSLTSHVIETLCHLEFFCTQRLSQLRSAKESLTTRRLKQNAAIAMSSLTAEVSPAILSPSSVRDSETDSPMIWKHPDSFQILHPIRPMTKSYVCIQE